ncbi:NAD(P)-dependent dehydrogenase (short-subunit alcohol dehydrogenase family) [Devosia subaequoris]|uniref:NAD(P)-dependent dehydrogenase (Short-subunit alcohol dehydrogenase family) n=1 Tax=Devosia subaequoris TaxID=395930 RepID=A0A7W6IMJ9_9HYPH|nr:SDR family oxidoreductase [Devosia subaequoris]MBB4051846.1 NAD(P)-dependent dehydrogenase (short-subunit alcohol dehydrogenase family) [Devosia subaequoris]MCP1211003.1 SDR family oxidoreductase [Devosia subaequoris]
MSSSPFSVPNQDQAVALVTGAGDRIGAAIATTLADSGHTVIIHFRSDRAGASAVRDRIVEAGGRAEIIQADLANRDERAALVEKAAGLFGPLTLLVNNASAFEPDSARDVEETLWDTHFAVHAEAPVFLARDFAAQLPDGIEGNIINLVDERVLQPSPAFFSYFLSKSVLWTATQTLAQSLAPAIRVNAIGPGPVLPNAHQTKADFEQSVASLPLERNAGPEAIAQGVLAILSMRSFTGQMLALDGGQHLSFPARRGPTPRP